MKKLYPLLTVLFAFFLSGCIINGFVKNESGEGVADVTMTLSGPKSETVETDATGKFQFDDRHNWLPVGTYTVTPSKSGYSFTPASQTVTITTRDYKGEDKAWPVNNVDFIIETESDGADPTGNCTDDGPQTVMWQEREWQRCDDGKLHTWEEAKTYCQDLILGGYSDWHLPTKDELKSLVVCTNGTPTPLADKPYHPYHCGDGNSDDFATPTIDSSFQCRVFAAYWSSTEKWDQVWNVDFYYGLADWDYGSYLKYVRCVRL